MKNSGLLYVELMSVRKNIRGITSGFDKGVKAARVDYSVRSGDSVLKLNTEADRFAHAGRVELGESGITGKVTLAGDVYVHEKPLLVSKKTAERKIRNFLQELYQRIQFANTDNVIREGINLDGQTVASKKIIPASGDRKSVILRSSIAV